MLTAPSPDKRLTSLTSVSPWAWEERGMGVGGEPEIKHCPSPCTRAGRSQLSRECLVLRPAQSAFPPQNWHHTATLCLGRKRVGVWHLLQGLCRGHAGQAEGTMGSSLHPPPLPLSPFLPSGCFFPSAVHPPGQTEGQFWGPYWKRASRQSSWIPGTPSVWHLVPPRTTRACSDP